MERFDTHLCLVSAQAVPNLLPVLDERSRPRHVALAVSPEMQAQAQSLAKVIKQRCNGTTVEILELGNAYDYATLADNFTDFVITHASARVALNVTGGTKMMAVAAQEVFRANGQPVFYVNVDTDEVVHVGMDGQGGRLQAAMKVRDLLESQGYAIENMGRPQLSAAQRDLCARLVDHVRLDGIGLGLLNRLAAADDARRHLSVPLTERDQDSQSLHRMIDLFEQAGQVQRQQRQLTFLDESARQFVNGGWLEAHVYQVLQDLRGSAPGITDVVMGITFVHPNGRTRNEVDVACLIRNTLHLIECKTANLAQPGSGVDDRATEALYKAEALLKIGGLRTRAMVVDYRGSMARNQSNMDRASSAGIVVAAADQLRDLKGFISRVWLRESR